MLSLNCPKASKATLKKHLTACSVNYIKGRFTLIAFQCVWKSPAFSFSGFFKSLFQRKKGFPVHQTILAFTVGNATAYIFWNLIILKRTPSPARVFNVFFFSLAMFFYKRQISKNLIKYVIACVFPQCTNHYLRDYSPFTLFWRFNPFVLWSWRAALPRGTIASGHL